MRNGDPGRPGTEASNGLCALIKTLNRLAIFAIVTSDLSRGAAKISPVVVPLPCSSVKAILPDTDEQQRDEGSADC